MPGRRAFYLHNPSGDIGHAVHLLRLLAALKARGGRNLIFLRAPSSYPHGLFREHGEVVALPAAPTPASGRSLSGKLAAFRPSVFVTEFFPFGRKECAPEVLPALRFCSEKGIRAAASVPMPYFSSPAAELLAAAEFYDRILIHTPERDLDYMARAVVLERRITAKDFLAVFAAIGRKTLFTGYLLPRMPRSGPEKGFVLVTRGGGSVSDELIEAAVLAAPIAGLPVLAVAGPSTPPSRLERFRRLAAGREASVLLGMTDLPGLMARAALCVSTAGGSVYEMLSLNKKMVLAPYCGERGREHSDQLARAWLARDLAGAEIILPADITPGKLAAACRRRLRAPLKRPGAARSGLFSGAARSAAAIESLCR